MKTTITTYDKAVAEKAVKKMNARRRRLGLQNSQIRSFQKSVSDGKGDFFTITIVDGEPVDVTSDFDAIF